MITIQHILNILNKETNRFMSDVLQPNLIKCQMRPREIELLAGKVMCVWHKEMHLSVRRNIHGAD